MDKSYKKPLLLITFGVILFAAFNNLNYVANFLKSCIGLLAPILSGLLLAFVLSVPVRGLAKRLRRKLTKATDRQIDMISLLLTLICVIAIIALLCVIAIPQLTASVKSKRALYAYCKESVADRICHISKLAHDTYAKFLSGQCVEVMILGTLIFLSFSVAGIPYAGLTAVLTAAFAFVPYIGGFLSCAFGILFTLLAAPNKALLCLIVYQATQFVENQFIYPHVVGNSVGLSPFWTLLAVLLGGKLFGVLGMIFFIPLMALVSQLLHESIERRLHTRKPELSNVQSNSDENTDISQ